MAGFPLNSASATLQAADPLTCVAPPPAACLGCSVDRAGSAHAAGEGVLTCCSAPACSSHAAWCMGWPLASSTLTKSTEQRKTSGGELAGMHGCALLCPAVPAAVLLLCPAVLLLCLPLCLPCACLPLCLPLCCCCACRCACCCASCGRQALPPVPATLPCRCLPVPACPCLQAEHHPQAARQPWSPARLGALPRTRCCSRLLRSAPLSQCQVPVADGPCRLIGRPRQAKPADDVCPLLTALFSAL